MKKAEKGHEGQKKARESIIPKFYDFFLSTILWPLTYVLAFEIPYFESGIQIWTKGTLKHLTR